MLSKEVVMLLERARRVVLPATLVLIVAAPLAQAEQKQTAQAAATIVTIDDLQDHADQYIGKRIRTTAEVDKVLGPRAFTIDERGWLNLGGETLVQVSSPLAAPVREGTMVTVEGTLKRYNRADLQDDWGWLSNDQRTELALERGPVLVADHIFGTNANVAFIIDLDKKPSAAGWSGAGQPLTTAAAVADADERLVGRHATLDAVVSRTSGKGFFVKSGDESFFVLPAKPQQVTAGSTVTLDGFLMQMPQHMRDTLNVPDGANEDIYLYVVRTT
jgi:hypothetical protein